MIEDIVKKQREFFLTGVTKNVSFRIEALKKLKSQMYLYSKKINDAFIRDFNKPEFDVVATEFSMVMMEIDFMLKNIKRFSKRKKVKTSLINFPSKGYIYKEPFGVVLIMSPWNYPLQLALSPLVGAIAAGNTAVVKPSNYSSNVSNVIKELLECFNEEYIAVVTGGRSENQELLEQRFDYIFFTGGESVGRLVMEKASKNLTPVSLELGGKSPCIVEESADINISAKRIAWGKFLNAGQTCVAPDFLLVQESIKEEFVKKLIEWVEKFYYTDGVINKDFCHIINDKHTKRLENLIDKEKLIFGGKVSERLIEPTILENVTEEDLIMKEEIFGPLLPIIFYKNIDDAIMMLKKREKPLALYLFTNNKTIKNKVLQSISFGGGCINDTIMHLSNEELPFGGVGNSGMGSYHGKKSFETFSHMKSIFVKGKLEINLKYPPYTKKKTKMLKRIVKASKN